MFSLSMLVISIIRFVFRALFGFLAFLGNLLVSGFRGIGNVFRRRRISRLNSASQNVIADGAYAISERLAACPVTRKMVVSGNSTSGWRDEISAFAALNAHRQGASVVVLHKANNALVGALRGVSDGVVAVSPENAIYDPCMDLDSAKTVNLLCGVNMGAPLDDKGRAYIQSLVDLVRHVLKRSACLTLLRDMAGQGLAVHQNRLDAALNAGRISNDVHDRIVGGLTYGMPSRMGAAMYLDRLCVQLDAVRVRAPMPDGDIVSVHRAVRDGKLLTLDLSSVTDLKLGYGLVVNEILAAAAVNRRPIYVVLDDLPIADNDALRQLIVASPAHMGMCVSGDDLYASCGGKRDTFESIVGQSGCTVLFRQPGQSANLWEEAIGKYRKYKTSQSIAAGSMKPSPFRVFPGSNRTRTETIDEVWEPRVPAVQLTSLNEGEVVVVDNDNGKVLRTVMKNLL